MGKDEWDAPPQPPPPPPPPPPVVVTREADQSAQLEPWELDRKDNIDDELVSQCAQHALQDWINHDISQSYLTKVKRVGRMQLSLHM